MLRKSIFWIHLVVGLVVGLFIGLMSLTGLSMAFEAELVEWAERDARTVQVPADAKRLEVDALVDAARRARPGSSPVSISLYAEPSKAVAVSFGRDQTYYVNPYTAEVRQPASTAVHDGLHFLEDLHRFLAQTGDRRPIGKAMTGAAATGFFFLGLSGLYLWWPRSLTLRALRPITTFTGAKGKARDWNWHNVFGFWALPLLLISSSTGMIISYKWATDLLYHINGEAPPPPRNAQAAPQTYSAPAPATASTTNAFVKAVAERQPDWSQMTLRWSNPRQGAPAAPASEEKKAREENVSKGLPAVTVAVKTVDQFPRFSARTFTLHPYTTEVLKDDSFAQNTPGRKARMWARYLHTGEAFGAWGKTVAAVSAFSALILVYTGFALAWRRFFGSKKTKTA